MLTALLYAFSDPYPIAPALFALIARLPSTISLGAQPISRRAYGQVAPSRLLTAACCDGGTQAISQVRIPEEEEPMKRTRRMETWFYTRLTGRVNCGLQDVNSGAT
jgi:hypothetical protein